MKNDTGNYLQRFFDASLIPADTTDERLKHYQAAAADLAKRFGEAPHDAVSASRVAIDPKCPSCDPWFEKVQEGVKVHWKTFLANHHDAPRQICRAILLQALSKAAEEYEDLSAAIWNSTSSLLPHMNTGPEQTITCEFISRLGNECEAESTRKWQMDGKSSGKLPELEIKLTPIEVTKLDESALAKGMLAAAGPNDIQGQRTGGNPYWPTHSPHQWVSEFASRSANSIAVAVDKTVAGTGPALKKTTDQLEPALKKYFSALTKLFTNSALINQRLTTLLWWKQAVYSPKLRCSYRQLEQAPAAVAIAMSFDISDISGAPLPQSVEFFLRETIRAVVPENPRLSMGEFAAAVKESAQVEPFLPMIPSGAPHRVSLWEFLSLARQQKPSAEMIRAYVGIEPTTALPLSEWAVWLLRERLADILSDNES